MVSLQARDKPTRKCEIKAECGALSEKGVGHKTRGHGTSEWAARHVKKQSAIALLVFTLWQCCEDMKHHSGVLWQALLLFIPVSDKKNKAPTRPAHTLFVRMRHKAAGWSAQNSHCAHLSVIFVDRKQVWVSGHFLWLPVSHHRSALKPAETACRLLMLSVQRPLCMVVNRLDYWAHKADSIARRG